MASHGACPRYQAVAPLTGRERFGDGSAPPLFDRWDTPARFTVPSDPPDMLGYLDLALEGGFPGAIAASVAGVREDWMGPRST